MKVTPALFLFTFLNLSICAQNTSKKTIRAFHDSIGFAKNGWQMDSIISRIDQEDKSPNPSVYKAVINPHDDYKYAAGLYAKTLSGIKANTIILIGVAHRARNYDLQDKLIFGSFKEWDMPYGNVKVSNLRDSIKNKLPKATFVSHDDMMQLEHSLEAIVPFLQYQNPNTEIIPILVPYMKFEDMGKISEMLSESIIKVMKSQKLEYGRGFAVVISNDAIHYGSEDWGGSDLAPFGTDVAGNEKAHQKDLSIIDESLIGELSLNKIAQFNRYTVEQEDYKEYKWTWCGRYSVPFGLLLANNINQKLHNKNLNGTLIGYRSSLKNDHLKVEDLGMGTTAPAKPTHWVAYLGMAYK